MAGTLFILNPAAGHGRAQKVWDDIREEALESVRDAYCLKTDTSGHAIAIARDAVLSGVERLIAVGGDGTFSEVLEGVMQTPEEKRRKVALSCLPAGSGCDLARHLAYPADTRDVLNIVSNGKERLIDVGRIKYRGLDGAEKTRHFINIAAFGLAGDVAHHVHRTGKALGGTLSYALSSIWALATARAKNLHMTADGHDISGHYHLGVLANTSSMGGGMLIAPTAADNDGRMDLVLVADMSRLQLLKKFPKLYRGTHLHEPGVALKLVRDLKVDSDEPVYLNIDGEADGMLPASFEVLPKAITVLIPAKNIR